jgi:hypothetical protein
MKNRLEAICLTADETCENLSKDAEIFITAGREECEKALELEKEVLQLKAEVATSISQWKIEESKIKTDMIDKKKKAMEITRSSIANCKNERGTMKNTNVDVKKKQQQKELIKSLGRK